MDIYVLERAFLSTHPDSQDLVRPHPCLRPRVVGAEHLTPPPPVAAKFDAFMKKYSKTAKCFSGVGQRLHAVRKRGRKREAFG